MLQRVSVCTEYEFVPRAEYIWDLDLSTDLLQTNLGRELISN